MKNDGPQIVINIYLKDFDWKPIFDKNKYARSHA